MDDKVPMLGDTELNLPAVVVSTRYLEGLGDLTDLEDIIGHLEASKTPDIVIIDVLEDFSLLKYAWPRSSSNLFALWVAPISMDVNTTLSQHMPRIRESLVRKQLSTTAIYITRNQQTEQTYPARLACFQKVHSTNITYNMLPIGEEERACVRHYRRKREYSYPLLLWKRKGQGRWYAGLISLFLLLIAVTLIIAASRRTTFASATRPWIAYPTPDTEGPLYQLGLIGTNVTTWTAQNDPSQWRLRLDDQQMIPINLVDERELAVQAWFEDNFPFLREKRDSGQYLDPDFLALYEDIPISRRYHVAHCVAAVRRYLTAMETGRHVCPRDVSLGHLKHCTKQLEDFAFLPKGARYSENIDTLRWHTDVCFEEPA